MKRAFGCVVGAAFLAVATGAAADEPARTPASPAAASSAQASSPPSSSDAASSAQGSVPPSAPASASAAAEAAPSSNAGVDTAAAGSTGRGASQGVLPPGRKQPGDNQRLLGAGLGAAGFLTMAVGGFFAISGMTLYDEAESRCRNGACERRDVEDADLARSRANVGGWILLGGAALVGGGLALYFTAPARNDGTEPKERTDPKPTTTGSLGLAPSLGGLSAFGTF